MKRKKKTVLCEDYYMHLFFTRIRPAVTNSTRVASKDRVCGRSYYNMMSIWLFESRLTVNFWLRIKIFKISFFYFDIGLTSEHAYNNSKLHFYSWAEFLPHVRQTVLYFRWLVLVFPSRSTLTKAAWLLGHPNTRSQLILILLFMFLGPV